MAAGAVASSTTPSRTATYLVAGMVPVVLLLGFALWAVRLHEGGWWFTLGALVALRPAGRAGRRCASPGPYLVPTVSTMSGLLGDTSGAPATLVSTVPPVEPSGTRHAGARTSSGSSPPCPPPGSPSRRPGRSRPRCPLVLALGGHDPARRARARRCCVPRGVVVGLVVLAWVVVRDRRARAQRRADACRPGGRHRRAVVTVAPRCRASVGVLVPDDDQSDRVLLRGRDRPAADRGAGRRQRPAGDGRDDIRALPGEGRARRARGSASPRSTCTTASGWVPAEESPGSEGYGTFKRIGEDVRPLHPGGTESWSRSRSCPATTSDWLPMLGELTRIDLKFNPGSHRGRRRPLQPGDVERRGRSGESTSATTTPSRRCAGPRGLRQARRHPRADRRAAAAPRRLPRPATSSPSTAPSSLPLERVLLLARYLRINGTVRLTDDFDQSPVDLGRRMLGSRSMVATPFQYSALMALGASRLGVAARVVTGAEPGRRGLVDYGDVISWVELQFADGTWRSARPGALRRLPGSRRRTSRVALPDAEDFVADQVARATRGKDREIRPPDGSTDPDGTAEAPRRPAWQVVLGLRRASSPLGLAAGRAPRSSRSSRSLRRSRRRRTTSWSGLYVNGWQEVLDAARDRGTPVPEGWSRVAQAGAARRRDRTSPGRPTPRSSHLAAATPRSAASSGTRAWRCAASCSRDADGRHRWWALVQPRVAARRLGAPSPRPLSRRAQVRHEDRRAGSQQPARA